MRVGEPEGKRPLGRPKHRRENNIMDLKGIRCEGMDWSSVACNRDRWRAVLKTVMNFVFIKCREFLG